MKIGLDAIAAIGKGGNSTYSKNMCIELLRADSVNRFYLFSFLHDFKRKSLFGGVPKENWKEIPVYVSRMLWPFVGLDSFNGFLVRIGARILGIDIFHFTNPLNFVAGSYKSVVTIHDLAALYDFGWTKEGSRNVFKAKIGNIVKEASALIAVSEFTKCELIEKLNVPAEKITVVYEGASDVFYPEPDTTFIEKTYGTDNYILYVGQLQPRKNIILLIKAFAVAASVFSDLKLILVGSARDAAYRTEIDACIKALKIEAKVIFAGRTGDDVLRKLYSSARCLVYPSLFEGFGLPLVESLQCGTPAITSNTSSLPEVVGDAGLLVDPHSVESVADAIKKFLTDTGLENQLRNRTINQAKKFSWKNAAKETLAVYTKI